MALHILYISGIYQYTLRSSECREQHNTSRHWVHVPPPPF